MSALSNPRQHLHKLVDGLEEQQLSQTAQALEHLRHSSLTALLRDIPGLRVPEHWPPIYPEVELLTMPGEPVSE